jgi:hypothetical protein
VSIPKTRRNTRAGLDYFWKNQFTLVPIESCRRRQKAPSKVTKSLKSAVNVTRPRGSRHLCSKARERPLRAANLDLRISVTFKRRLLLKTFSRDTSKWIDIVKSVHRTHIMARCNIYSWITTESLVDLQSVLRPKSFLSFFNKFPAIYIWIRTRVCVCVYVLCINK